MTGLLLLLIVLDKMEIYLLKINEHAFYSLNC